jgi:translation initiation factor IF-3
MGNMIGIVSVEKGIERAMQVGLDLVEISPNADPPVCKILDSGKYKYELQKKKAAAKKNQKVIEVKEIKLRPVTGENDYQVKLKKAYAFLESGNKVKVTLRFRGREIAHKELGEKMLKRFEEDLQEVGKAEFPLKMDGKFLHIILAPHKGV